VGVEGDQRGGAGAGRDEAGASLRRTVLVRVVVDDSRYTRGQVLLRGARDAVVDEDDGGGCCGRGVAGEEGLEERGVGEDEVGLIEAGETTEAGK